MNTPTTTSNDLPQPSPDSPMVVLMMSEPVDPTARDPLVWRTGDKHPIAPTGKIIRMFYNEDGVDIFSTSPDVKEGGMIDYIPMKHVLIITRAASLDVFARELELAEYGEDDDEDDEDEPEDPETETVVEISAPTNGQATS